jgi:hypothetical protein
MSKIANRYLRLAFYSDTHVVRFLLALSELIWGVTLIAPGDTFGRPTYTVMAHVLPSEEVWGFIWIFTALTQMYILTTGDYHDKASVIFSGFNAILWWFVVISMYMSVWPIPAAISGELALAVGASWVYIRSGWIPAGARRCHADS